LKLGFVDAEGVLASETVKSFMSLSFYLFDIIMAVAFLVLIPFVNVEKKLPEINAELLRRKKEAILAKGGTWLEPEEQDRVEREQAEREAEENRIADLHQHCAKKGLDFETENAKYLSKQEDKRRKREAKQTKKKAKKKGTDTNENSFDGGTVE
jgi:GPH family glycoside/pentoside/hexuronide:cation symporter